MQKKVAAFYKMYTLRFFGQIRHFSFSNRLVEFYLGFWGLEVFPKNIHDSFRMDHICNLLYTSP